MSYNELVEKHFFSPQHVFIEDDAKNNFHYVSEGSVALGDAIEFYMQFDKASQKINVLKFKAYGNPYLIAGMSYLCQELQHKPLNQVNIFSAQKLIEVLSLPKTKYYVAYMLEDALKKLADEGSNYVQ